MPPADEGDELQQRVVAAADLVARTGARQFDIGYLHDDVPADKAGWYAIAMYRGGRITTENHAHPADAAEALARRLLTGAKCKCGKLVALDESGAVAFIDPVMTDGTSFPIGTAARAGTCRWRRDGQRWVSACGLGMTPAQGERPERG
jgi:hypothetical protein